MKPHTPRLPPARPLPRADAADGPQPKEPQNIEKASRTTQLRKSRQMLWQSIPELIAAAIDQAKDGNATHLKLLFDLAGLEKGALLPASVRAEKSLETILLEQWARDAEQRLAEQREADTRRLEDEQD